MPRPSSRELILDAYEDLLTARGAAHVTLEGVARQAQVSKGGLLYHFGAKEALRDALLQRLRDRTDEDLRTARASELGAVTYYLQTSVTEVDRGSPLHRTTMAVLRLAMDEPRVRETIRQTTDGWRGLIAEETGDELAASLITVLGDGLYLHAVLGVENRQLLDSLDEVVARLRR